MKEIKMENIKTTSENMPKNLQRVQVDEVEVILAKHEQEKLNICKQQVLKRVKRWYDKGGKEKMSEKYKQNEERVHKLVEKYKGDENFIKALLKAVPKDKLVSMIL